MAAGDSRGVVLVALVTSAAAAVAKLWAAALTGSSALLADGVHALAAAGSQTLLLVGLARSERAAPDDTDRRTGELYVFSFVAALLLFSLGAGVALHEGVSRLVTPHALTELGAGYAALGLALVLHGAAAAWTIAALNRRRGAKPARAPLRTAAGPTLLTVLIETLAALAGVAIAALGLALSHATATPAPDSHAAILIGLLLGAVAAVMSVEIRRLLVGKAAAAEPTHAKAADAPAGAAPKAPAPIRPAAQAAAPDALPPRLSRKKRKRRRHQKRDA